MANVSPPTLTVAEQRLRLKRVFDIADQLGFVGTVEYRHVYSRSGGAQYGQGQTQEDDLLIVYAEAFDRDADPEDFSLTATIAHERGHQMIVRHPRVAKLLESKFSLEGEEVLASLLSSLICDSEEERKNLFMKAIFELVKKGKSPDLAEAVLLTLRDILEAML